MKTPREFAEGNGFTGGELIAAIERRDAEHESELRAEMEAWQRRSIDIQRQEEEVETDRDALRAEVERLKHESTTTAVVLEVTLNERDALRARLVEAEKLLQTFPTAHTTEQERRARYNHVINFLHAVPPAPEVRK